MNERPTCYGQEWTVSSTECTGGYDAAHVNPLNGSHIRPRCEMFDDCGRVQRERAQGMHLPQYAPQPQPSGQPYGYQQRYGAAPTGYAMPASVRQAQPAVQPHYQPMPSRYQPVPQYPAAQPQYPAQPQPGYPMPLQPFAVQAPMAVPSVELMPRNWFAVPQVLAVHEPREERPGASFLVEVMRGMGMITGLVTADFFSNIPLLRRGGRGNADSQT